MAVISADTKDALARETPAASHCREALLAGLALYGSTRGAFVTHRNAVARLFWSLSSAARCAMLRLLGLSGNDQLHDSGS